MTQQSHSWAYIQIKTFLGKDTCTCMFTAALFTIAKTWNQPKCPLTDDWFRKIWYIYTVEYYSAVKKEQSNAICSNMDGTRDSHPEWNKSERKANTIWYHLYLESNTQHKGTFSKKRKSWTWRIDLWLPDGRGREWEGSGAWAYQTQLRVELQADPAE